MFMLSFNSQKAEAIAVVDDVIVIGGVCIATSVIVGLMVKSASYEGYDVNFDNLNDVKSYIKTKLLDLTAIELVKYFATVEDSSGQEYVQITSDGYDWNSNVWPDMTKSPIYQYEHSTVNDITSNTTVSATKPFMLNNFYMVPYQHSQYADLVKFKVLYGDSINFQYYSSRDSTKVLSGTFQPTNDCYVKFFTEITSLYFAYSYDNIVWTKYGSYIQSGPGCVDICGYKTLTNTVYVPGSSLVTNTGIETPIPTGDTIAYPVSGQYSSDGTTKVYDGIDGATATSISGLTQKTTNSTEIDDNYDIKINVDSINRIFNNKTGHLTSNTAENRKILELVANNAHNYIGMDGYENEWYTSINSDGTQIWVEVTDGKIVNGGVNEFPIYFDVQNTEDESFDAIVEAVTTTTTSSAIKPEDFESDDAIDDSIKSIKDAKKDHILKGTISGRKDTSSAHAWEVFFDGRKPSFEEIEPYIKKAFRGECEHIPFETRAGTIFKKLYKADINGNEVWVYTLPRNGKMIIEDAGVILK